MVVFGNLKHGFLNRLWSSLAANVLILITNICCVIDKINLLYYRKTRWDGTYRSCSQSRSIQQPILEHNYSLNTSANRIKLDLEGQYNFVNSMGSHSVRIH
jgi:hypothetical protein